MDEEHEAMVTEDETVQDTAPLTSDAYAKFFTEYQEQVKDNGFYTPQQISAQALQTWTEMTPEQQLNYSTDTSEPNMDHLLGNADYLNFFQEFRQQARYKLFLPDRIHDIAAHVWCGLTPRDQQCYVENEPMDNDNVSSDEAPKYIVNRRGYMQFALLYMQLYDNGTSTPEEILQKAGKLWDNLKPEQQKYYKEKGAKIADARERAKKHGGTYPLLETQGSYLKFVKFYRLVEPARRPASALESAARIWCSMSPDDRAKFNGMTSESISELQKFDRLCKRVQQKLRAASRRASWKRVAEMPRIRRS